MNPQKVRRESVHKLEDLPNIGKAMADDLRLIGISRPEQLAEREAFEMYKALCEKTGQRQDPCVLDVFMSVVHFMRGGEARPWWEFTPERFRLLSGQESLALYQSGTKIAKHWFCMHCGIHPFSNPRAAPEMFSINVRCLDDFHALRNGIEIVQFDGWNWEEAAKAFKF